MASMNEEGPRLGRRQVLLKARPSLQITRQIQGGRAIYVVKDPFSLRFFHLEEPQHFLLERMDGSHALDDVRIAYEREHRPHRLTLEEVEDFALHLLHCGLVEVVEGQTDRALERAQDESRKRYWSRWLNLLYIKVPFGSPDAFLGSLQGLGRILFHPASFALGLALACAAGFVMIANWRQVSSELPTYRELFTWRSVLQLGAVFVAVKVLHELGHGLCCKVYGGKVHEFGAVLLFFFPTLYCNVSDSWTMPERWKRILINLAGMWMELLIATFGVLIWKLTYPGHLLHSLALNTIIVCGVHTIVFNANPLMRFDGYFVLTDWMQIPNLAQRSRRALHGALTGWFGATVLDDPIPGPRRFMLLYGIASLIYRCLVTAGMLWVFILFMKEQHLRWLGLTLAVLGVLMVLAPPTYHLFRTFAQLGRSAQMKPSRSLITLCLLASLLAIVFLVPFPRSVKGMGVTQIEPEHRIDVVVPLSGGFLDELFVRDGQRVRKGDVLAILRNPDLECRLRMNEADQALRREQVEAIVGHLAQFADFRSTGEGPEQIEHELRSLAEQEVFLKREKDALILRASRDGVVMHLPTWETQGKWQTGGDVLLTIGDPSRMRASILVAASDRQLLEDQRLVRFLPHGTGTARQGRVTGISPSESTTIPAHLAGRFGGDIATKQDPATRNEKPVTQHYLVTVQLDGNDSTQHCGILGDARIEAGSATVWWRVKRWFGETIRTGW